MYAALPICSCVYVKRVTRPMKRFLFITFLFFTTTIFAQNTVTGVVYLKSDSNPLVGVMVKDKS